MALETPRPQVRISKVASRYLLFDIDDVMYLRRNHNICSPNVGTIPQNPSQSIFMGLPIELMAEEAQVLVAKQVAYVVDDAAFHLAQVPLIDDASRKTHLQTMDTEVKKANLAWIEIQASKKPKNIQRVKKDRKKKPAADILDIPSEVANSDETAGSSGVAEDTSLELFASEPTASPKKEAHKPADSYQRWHATLTTSNTLLPSSPDKAPIVPVDVLLPQYPLYAHLQDKGFYMMPGIRFGCDYNVYPGDPLRFHSHFQAKAYGWEEPIPILDLVGAGRLGNATKKSVLIGGEVPKCETEGYGENKDDGVKEESSIIPPVRVFSIEWAHM